MGARGFRWDRAFVAAFASVAASAASPIPALAAPSDRALAESLFLEGRDLFAADKVSEACPKFAESYRLDPALGTLLNLAVCHEKEGKLATAWAEFRDAAAEARSQRQPDRETMARRHVEALAPQLAHVILVAPSEAPPSLVVKLDGSPVGRAAWGSKLPIDPGEHRLEASAPDKKPALRAFTIAKGSTDTLQLEIPALDDAAAATPLKPMPPLPATEPVKERSSSSQRTIGWIVGGAGVVGVGIGAVFGARVLGLKSDRDAHCGAGNVCDAEGVTLDRDARSAATVSTVGFVAGSLLLAGGLVLVLTSPSAKSQASIGIRPTFGGATLGGTF
jgi:hypothetical protein